MIGTLAAFTLAVLTSTHNASTHTDTTFAVRQPMRLTLDNFAGDVLVRTWPKNAIRIVAEHSSRAHVRVTPQGQKLSVEIVPWRGIPTSVDYRLTVPKWLALELSGVSTEIDVGGVEGEINAQSVSGDVRIAGGAGFVNASSVSGDVTVRGARGKIECSSVDADVTVAGSSGAVAVSSVNGDVRLNEIDSDDVEVSTVNGSVTYDGTIRDGGSYKFNTTNGDVSVAVPARANAIVSISTYSGEFESEFPVTFVGTHHRKQFKFTLGRGSARLDLESFNGGIQLRRPGSPAGASSFEYKHEYQEQKKQYEKLKQHTKQKHGDGDEPDEPDDE